MSHVSANPFIAARLIAELHRLLLMGLSRPSLLVFFIRTDLSKIPIETSRSALIPFIGNSAWIPLSVAPFPLFFSTYSPAFPGVNPHELPVFILLSTYARVIEGLRIIKVCYYQDSRSFMDRP
jgi:hypothetical protein